MSPFPVFIFLSTLAWLTSQGDPTVPTQKTAPLRTNFVDQFQFSELSGFVSKKKHVVALFFDKPAHYQRHNAMFFSYFFPPLPVSVPSRKFPV